MKKLILGLLLLVSFSGWGQVSVFDCNTYSANLTQSELDAESIFYNTCYELGQINPIAINDNEDKTIKAANQIHLIEDVHIGTFNSPGQAHLLIEEESELDIAVMNYSDLNGVLRYKKLEFGVVLPPDILDRISMFIEETGPTQQRLNPFLAWDIEVEGIFYNESSGWYETIDGFYTREYVQNPATSDWDDVGTEYPFRIRYAPPSNDSWTCYIRIKVNGQVEYTSNTFNFNVIESGDPGYVLVHENNRNLKRGDRMIYPVGQNFPSPDEPCLAYAGGCYTPLNETMVYDTIWSYANGDTTYFLDEFYYGHNLYTSNNSEKAANIVAWNNYLEILEQYFQTSDGGSSKYFRTIQLPHSSLLEFEERGNYYDRLHYAAEQDKILDLCEEYDALFMFNLMMHEPMMKYANYNKDLWDWDYYMEDGSLPLSSDYWIWEKPVYCYNDDPSYVKQDNTIHIGTKKPYEMFTNKSDLAYHKQRTRYYIARYGYSTKIYSFELLSEPWHLGEAWTSGQSNQGGGAPFLDPSNSDHDSTRYAIRNYHKIISEYIKDSLNHKKQLIGINMANELYADQGGIDASVMIPSIDLVGFNPYYVVPNALIKSNTNYMKDYVDRINSKRTIDLDSIIGYTVIYGDSLPIYNPTGLVGLPVIISEGGTAENYMPCSNYDLDMVDKMTLPFTGVAGINTWLGYRYNFLDFEHENDVVTMPSHAYDMWDNTIRVKNHMNGNDVINTLSEGGGYWSHGMGIGHHKNYKNPDDKEAVELQAYVSNNKKLVVGYVRNRTYNAYTKRSTGSKCKNISYDNNGDVKDYKPIDTLTNFHWDDIKNSEQLKVDGVLALKKYDVDFYGDVNGSTQYISTDSKLTSASGKLKLRYPELQVEESWQNRPVIWFVAKREGYNGMMPNHNIAEDSTDAILKELLAKEKDTLSQKNSLKVYPNPFEDYFTIVSSVIDKMVIQEPSGRIVLQKEVSKGENIIRAKRLTNGVYFVRFLGQSRTFKIVKQ